jgi:hypothetical protein
MRIKPISQGIKENKKNLPSQGRHGWFLRSKIDEDKKRQA